MYTKQRSYPGIHDQALANIAAALRALKLDGLKEHEVEARDFPWNGSGQIYRGITVFPEGMEFSSHGTVNRNDVGYRCGLAFCLQRDNTASPQSRVALWQEVAFRRLNDQRIGTIKFAGADRMDCKVGHFDLRFPKSVADADRWEVRALMAVYWVRQPRDQGA